MNLLKSNIIYNEITLFSELNTVVVSLLGLTSIYFLYSYTLYSYIPITFLGLIVLLKITSIKNAATLLDKKQNKISIEQFNFFINKLPTCSENYQNIIKIAYYNSKLDWLDLLLNKYNKEEPQSIENNIELTLQFILWGGLEAYQVLKRNYIFYDTKLALNMKIIKKLFIMYAYEEKYIDLREIFKDLLIYDKTLIEKLKCLKLNSDYMIMLNRLDLDLTLVTKSKRERKIKV